jgi:hypothetical protein
MNTAEHGYYEPRMNTDEHGILRATDEHEPILFRVAFDKPDQEFCPC